MNILVRLFCGFSHEIHWSYCLIRVICTSRPSPPVFFGSLAHVLFTAESKPWSAPAISWGKRIPPASSWSSPSSTKAGGSNKEEDEGYEWDLIRSKPQCLRILSTPGHAPVSPRYPRAIETRNERSSQTINCLVIRGLGVCLRDMLGKVLDKGLRPLKKLTPPCWWVRNRRTREHWRGLDTSRYIIDSLYVKYIYDTLQNAG